MKKYMMPRDAALHKKAHAYTRDDALEVYKNYEVKRDMVNQAAYANVDSQFSYMYAGIDPRRKSEMADAGMVAEDRKAMANLSNDGYQRQYPKAGYYSNPYIDDSKE